ncbi:MAG: trimethylamine methyltransferase family protein [Desulfobacterales bacterium]
MQVEETVRSEACLGDEALYRRIQEDAVTLIESLGVRASNEAAKKILDALDPGETDSIVFSPEAGRFYVPGEVIDRCMERIRQGFDYWPRGLGTGGMAAYVVDREGPRPAELEDIRQLAQVFGRTDALTSIQSSFNPCGQIKRSDLQRLGTVECACIDLMIEYGGGKMVTPTIRSERGIRHLALRHEQGQRIGAALSIISTFLTVSEEMLAPFLRTVQSNVPFLMNSMPIGGLTGPYSVTSLATLGHAEALFGMVLGQLIRPGIRCINAAMPTVADMSKKEMPMMFGSRANTIVNLLIAEVNAFLGLPSIQSACGHSRDTYDEAAERESAETYSLVNRYRYHSLRHLFGFAAQLNDFSIEVMEWQIELYQRIRLAPVQIPDMAPIEYDPDGLEAIFEGIDRNDFRNLDHTLRNVGRAFAS